MKLIKVAAAALNTTPLDWEGNTRAALAAIEEARRQGVSVLCLPELGVTGYGCEDAFYGRGVQERALQMLETYARATAGMVVSVGLPLMHQNALLNAACLLVDGRVVGFVPKQHLAGDGIHYEPRWFKAWPAGVRATACYGASQVPLGDLLFDVGGLRMGFEICEDAWVAQRPGGALARKGLDLIFNPSASHFALGKHAVRERLVNEGARAFNVAYLYANLLGNEAGRVIYDGGALVAQGERILARGARFSFADCSLASAVIDVDATRTLQARNSSFEPGFGADEDRVVVPFVYPERQPEAEAEPSPDPFESKEEEFTRAVSLALFDYLRKSRSEGFVVSLSGGCDSSVVTLLCATMVDLGVAELGRERFLAKLKHVRGLAEAKTTRELVSRLLTCAYQSTRNSSSVTREAAREVAQAVGAQFLELDVDAAVAGYTAMVEKALGRPFVWDRDDLALQNIQARARGPSVWMIANARNALLLATSNRSEVAVGYATMDGDTCGGLSPIAGIDKAFLRRYLAWLEKQGPRGLRPVPALSAVTRQQPTAELRPSEQGQTDEADLMPYSILDLVERAAIRDKQTPVEIFSRLKATHADVAPRQLAGWIERFFRLWCRNQWKRERYAPSFHLDDESLDPRGWCRFPILSSGFEAELAELRQLAGRGG
jgi:NAD+ synthase (glutamine-hydrolysing)